MWLATIGEPARIFSIRSAEVAWPGWGRSGRCSSGTNTRSVPSSASTDIAAVRSTVSASSSRSASAMISMPSMPSVPLTRARPSFSRSSTGSIPASASASPAGRSAPSSPTTSPSPISARATWESGARSPEQPREPNSRTAGVMPALSMATKVSTTTGRTPVRPEASVVARRNISARTTSRSTTGPMPAAWERIRDFCSCARDSSGMCLSASAPKPVETP